VTTFDASSDDRPLDSAARADEERRREEKEGRVRRFRGQLGGLLDPEAALRRGQSLVTEVTRGTKDEVVRLISAEVRNFLDKMDAVDLLQQVIAGLTIDVNMQVRVSRDERGLQPEITRGTSKIRTGSPRGDGSERAAESRTADPRSGDAGGGAEDR